MTIAEVTVAYVNPPRGSAISGSIKDSAGAYYGIKWPDWENEFKPGNKYRVEYTQKGQFRNITRYKLMAEGAAPAPSAASATHRGDVSPDVARRMFVGACMHGFAAASGDKLTPRYVADTIAVLEKGYDMHYNNRQAGANDSPPPKNDTKDESTW